MNKLEKVSVRKEANVYYEGKVSSRVIFEENGDRKTLGLVLPGTYEFSAEDKEILEILEGVCTITYDGHENRYEKGDVFSIPANTTFLFGAEEITDYCCSYVKE